MKRFFASTLATICFVVAILGSALVAYESHRANNWWFAVIFWIFASFFSYAALAVTSKGKAVRPRLRRIRPFSLVEIRPKPKYVITRYDEVL
ncbi:hypothetical protein KW796_03305 [Candidatus Parcubacteria bacterium]|nr:hypothetical protein [Candidatus Parcubacteria bacterium]